MVSQEKPVKFRHELKHYINLADYLSIRQRLLAVARPDGHTGPEGTYKIRSLYFETPEDKALNEKLSGINQREKFRLHYYNGDLSNIKLEKKTKIGGLGNKRSAQITREECEKLMEGELEWMMASEEPLLLELYAKMKYQQLKPKTVVDYVREPYVFGPGNVRMTIDSQIKTGIHSKDFFHLELPTIPTAVGNVIILEVKYDAFLPDIMRDIIQQGNRKSTAYSKYAISRIYG